MAPKAIFAQLCQELTEIKDAEDHHVFELYQSVETAATYPFAQSGTLWPISIADFIANFYPDGGGQFKIQDCSYNIMLLNNWKILDYPFVNPGVATDISYNAAELLTLIPQQWVLDLSHNSPCCWTACSYMAILKELLPARNLCNWDCDVCCAMSSWELASVLNHEHSTTLPGFERTPEIPVVLGDELVLSVLFTNPNTRTKPIELHLNFLID